MFILLNQLLQLPLPAGLAAPAAPVALVALAAPVALALGLLAPALVRQLQAWYLPGKLAASEKDRLHVESQVQRH